MYLKKNCVAVSLAALAATPALATTTFGDLVKLRGFGTVGVVSSDNDKVDFVRDGAPKGAGKDASWTVDSKLGLQVDVAATSWLSATLQVLAEQRFESGVKADLEWGYVKLQPTDSLTVRLGRTAPVVFMVSDSRNVGFANTMVRMPNDVYAQNLLKRLTGVDATYGLKTPLGMLSASAMAGEGKINNANVSLDAKKVRGFNLLLDTEVGSFRLGQVKTDVHVTPLDGNPATVSPYTFSGIGYQLDTGKLIASAEYVTKKIDGSYSVLDSKGWYVMGGYRIGAFTPYVSVARARVENVQANILNGDEDTLSLGVRWDLINGAALKFQFDQVDPKGGRGISFPLMAPGVGDKTHVLSLALDFVF